MARLDRTLLQAFPRIERIAPVLAAVLVMAAAGAAIWWVLQPEPDVGIVAALDSAPVDLPPTELGLPPANPVQPAPAPVAVVEAPPPSANQASAPSARPSPEPLPAEPPPPPAAGQHAAIVAPDPVAAPPAFPDAPGLDTSGIPETDRAAGMRRFIAGFDGGACFFATPTEVGADSAAIEAFAVALPSVEVLDQEFRRENGFEAQIGFRPVAPAQCAAVDFVRGLAASSVASPTVTIQSYNVRNGEPLAGAIEHDGSPLVVLLVADDGSVHNLSDRLRQAGTTTTFQVPLIRSEGGDVKPLLLVVIASDAPLATPPPGERHAADQTFPQLAQEARRSGAKVAVALKYVKVEG